MVTISWSSYFIAIGTVCLLYYFYVIIKYYPDELRKFVSKGASAKDNDIYEEIPEEMFDRVELLSKKLHVGFSRVSRGEIQMEDMLREELGQFGDIENEILRAGIFEIIKNEYEKSGITANEGVISAMWG